MYICADSFPTKDRFLPFCLTSAQTAKTAWVLLLCPGPRTELLRHTCRAKSGAVWQLLATSKHLWPSLILSPRRRIMNLWFRNHFLQWFRKFQCMKFDSHKFLPFASFTRIFLHHPETIAQMHSASPQACGRKGLGGGQLHEERGLDIDLVASRTSPPRRRTTHSSIQLLTGKQSQRSMAVRPVYAGPRRFSSKQVQ